MSIKKVLNMYEEKCSTIISKTKQQIKQMNKGDTIVVKTDSICACKKIPNWCRENNYTVNIQKIDKDVMNFTIHF